MYGLSIRGIAPPRDDPTGGAHPRKWCFRWGGGGGGAEPAAAATCWRMRFYMRNSWRGRTSTDYTTDESQERNSMAEPFVRDGERDRPPSRGVRAIASSGRAGRGGETVAVMYSAV